MSKGAEIETVPDVKNRSYDEAKRILEEKGFSAEFGGNENSADVDSDKVCRTDPEGGKKAAKGSKVKIYISNGKEQGQVPSVVGDSEAVARSKIEAAGFVCSVSYESSDNVDEGNVISQSPSGGQKVDKGSTISIKVSSGSGMIEVPNVVGMTFEAAKSALQAAGFNVDVSGSGTKVISQSPISGNKAKKGSTITITLGT